MKTDWPILLVNPPVLLEKNNIGVDVFQPLGLAYIGAILREDGYPVSILDAAALGWQNVKYFDSRRDFNGLDFESIADEVRKNNPRVVGITNNFTIQKDSAFKVASVIKSVDKDIIVIVGGSHVTIRPEECLLNPDIDFAVLGEGELTILELMNKLTRGSSTNELKEVLGIAFREKDGFHVTGPRPYNNNLDDLPYPARDLLPMSLYFEAAKSKRANRDMDKPWATMITSRGCPFKCSFCSIHITMGRPFRYRSPENVAGELKELVTRYGVQQVDFEDDNLTCDNRRMDRI